MPPHANASGPAPEAFCLGRRKTQGERHKGHNRWCTAAFFFFAFSFFLLALSGCTRSEPPADLTVINGAEPDSLDPAIISTQTEMRIVKALFEGLTRLEGKNATAEPAIAHRWDMSPDGAVYTFHLRTNAFWSTGQSITAEDFVWSWRRALAPETGAEYASQLFFIKGAEDYSTGKTNAATGKPFTPEDVAVRALDPHTLRVELIGPAAFFLDLCAFPTLAAVPRFWIEKHGDRWLLAPPVPCNGAYTLEFWRLNDRVRLRRNPLHWDVANIRSELVDFLPIKSSTTALNLYETGAADVIWDKNLVPNELMDVLGKRPDCHKFDYLGTYFFRFNVKRKPFTDVRVRKAFALAVDRKQLAAKIVRSGETPTSHFTPKGMGVYEPPEGWGCDPEQARKLLAEAGFPGGKDFPPFHYLFKTDKLDEQVGVELQEIWRKELGVKMELRAMEPKVYYSAQSALDYDLSRSSWIGDYNDPNTFLDMFMTGNGNNRTGWSNPAYDELIRTANLQTDPKKRAALLRQAETLLIRDDLPIVPLWFYAGVNFYDPKKIEGIHANLLDEHPIHTIARKKN
ncbi:MAG: peptide ABC transporter substrate-binding protein [Verrucomicrobia bacterium]|nr:peptide ABC transporter substrate-binding protein [Verrucomicrobiota bacterium]NDE98953.1 peptide ABC transporter substrate-binding protein [Verrucomicrobiota bacterium]